MGVYIYSIRSPKLVNKVKLDNGEVVTVARYAYAYKPYYSLFGPEPKWQILAKARIQRSAKIWDNHIRDGNEWPQAGVVISDNKINVGNSVYAWDYTNKSLPVCFEDCSMNGAKFLGKVSEVLS